MVQQTALRFHDLVEPGELAPDGGDIVVDLFAGGGGASCGIKGALGVSPHIAINHSRAAIRMHEANHPDTRHYRTDVWDVNPVAASKGRPVSLLWLSPDCTHHSRAKGGKPVSKHIRSLAWVGVRWAAALRPRLMILENVPEFAEWCPLGSDHRPIKRLRGRTFDRFVTRQRTLGYRVEWRNLRGCDFGAPTTRERLFMVSRCDGLPIRWPDPTHGPGLRPYRTAAECIEWSDPAPSIFDRPAPHAENTLVRLATGVVRYVLAHDDPYIAPMPGTSPSGDHQCGAFVAKHYSGVIGHDLRRPLGTITARDHHSLVTATLAPAGTQPAAALRVAAFLMKYYGNGGQWQDLRQPLHTIVSKARFALVTVTLGGKPLEIVDIGMRMLRPRELARAQGFSDDYVLTGNPTDQIARIGNSVCPQVAEALVAANHPMACLQAA